MPEWPVTVAAIPNPAELADAVRAGDRRALARSITLVESLRPDHRAAADALLQEVLASTGAAIRVGVSGAPGVGKSTFIEALGTHLTGLGRRVAVLAVDPTSSRSGGSILGDKTRMGALAADPNAFIRPSPSGGGLGGVARRTREAMMLCEAAGYDVVLVETVGVGQSELAVGDMVDLFTLLVAPGAGDELQGIKRGIMELADLVVVNKADGALASAARQACADHKRALHLLRRRHASIHPEALLVSSLEATGIAQAWQALEERHRALTTSGELAGLRASQNRAWLWSELTDSLTEHLRTHPRVRALLPEVEAAVVAGQLPPAAGAHRLLEAFGIEDR